MTFGAILSGTDPIAVSKEELSLLFVVLLEHINLHSLLSASGGRPSKCPGSTPEVENAY